MKVLLVGLALFLSACASSQKQFVYGDVSPLLAPDLDVGSSLCGRLTGYKMLITADPKCEAKGAPERGVREYAVTSAGSFPRVEVTVFAEEKEAVSLYRHLCRTQSHAFEDDEVRWFRVPDGEACVIPYSSESGDAHNAWSPGSYEGSAVVRRGSLVVNIRDSRSTRNDAALVTPAAASLAFQLSPKR